jgi:plastocyanin
VKARRTAAGALAALCAVALSTGLARGQAPAPDPGAAAPLSSDVQHLHFKYGPIHVNPGQNLILIGPVTIEKPAYDGFMIRMKPNLVRADGTVPPVDQIHLHHGVFLNMSRSDTTSPSLPERFFGTGEEKTILQFPKGYGYFVRGSDVWAMNHMVHNQTPVADDVYITYDIDYVPADSALGRTLTAATPIWLDVQNGSAYPVFDVHRGAGGALGKWTYPDDAHPSPYGTGPPKNVWTANRDGTLIGAAGHVHPGGLWDDLKLTRPGAGRPAARTCRRVRHAGRHRTGSRGRSRRRCTTRPGRGDTVRLFRSEAKYWDPSGPVSWDMAMTATKPDWRVDIKKGDRLGVSTTYDTERASWYESMGIMFAYLAPPRHGVDPFTGPVDTTGDVTHGHLPENDNHGGAVAGAPDPAKLPDGGTVANGVAISAFEYLPGNSGLPGVMGDPPPIGAGQSLHFENFDAHAQVFHTITACAAPCNRSTGISYPLADGAVDFDSSELGYGPTGFTAASGQTGWNTPTTLKPGTYTYFCRIHPYMRGAFRVR